MSNTCIVTDEMQDEFHKNLEMARINMQKMMSFHPHLEPNDNSLCTECGGECCKSMGCQLSPEDIKGGVTYENVKSLLESGKYSIDWWDKDEKFGEYAIFIRARHVDADVIDPSYGGTCVMLTETGCSLSYDDRPKGGRELRAHPLHMCDDSGYTKLQSAKDWFEYRDILKVLFDEYNTTGQPIESYPVDDNRFQSIF